MYNIKTFTNSTGEQVAYVTPTPYRAAMHDAGFIHKNGAPYAFIVTRQGISIADYSRIATVTDYTLEQFRECLNASNRIYLDGWNLEGAANALKRLNAI
jgi:hypothetical protein